MLTKLSILIVDVVVSLYSDRSSSQLVLSRARYDYYYVLH
jgi:hypothetical protein